MIEIIWDLDSTLVDVEKYMHEHFGVPYPDKWDWIYEGKTHPQWELYNNCATIKHSDLTYVGRYILNNWHDPILIWTARSSSLDSYTSKWIHEKFPHKDVTWNSGISTQEKEEWLMNRQHHFPTFLVEDSPNFTDYSKIILIDKPYNRHVDADIRVHNEYELHEALSLVGAYAD